MESIDLGSRKMDLNSISLEYIELVFFFQWMASNSIVEMMKGDDGLESSAIRSKPLMGWSMSPDILLYWKNGFQL